MNRISNKINPAFFGGALDHAPGFWCGINIRVITVIILLTVFLPVNFSYSAAEENIEFLDIQAEEIDEKTVKISWVTNVATRGKILFGESEGNLPYFIIDNNKATKYHAVKLGNLKEETTYYYQIVAHNNYGQVYSFVRQFKTDEFKDITPPIVTNARAAYVSGTAAVITWETDEEAASWVEYDEHETYKNKTGGSKRVFTHQVILKNLKPNTKYFARLYSEDEDKNTSGVFYKEFQTLSSDKIDQEDLIISRLRPSSSDDSYIAAESVMVEFKVNHYAKGRVAMKRSGFKTQTKNLDYNSDHQIVFSRLTPNSAYNIEISMNDIFNKSVREEFAVTTKKIVNNQVVQISATNDQPINNNGTVCSADLLNETGYYGQYYNLSRGTPLVGLYDINLMPRETGWYDSKYFSFFRLDEDVNFGNKFFPLDEGLSGDPYYFSVYWRAILEAPDNGAYNYQIKSDDDSWVFVDGKLTTNLGGKHPAKEKERTVSLSKGLHSLEIYFAERNPLNSFFSFNLDQGIKVHPWPSDCSILPEYNANSNNNVVVAGIEFSYYTPASALYKTADSPDVYSIVNGERHYISSPGSFEEYGYMWPDVETVSGEKLLQYPRARLIKGPESPTIYHLYQRPENKWLKINLPSPSVFVSYPGNFWGNVIVVTQIDIDSYPGVKFIRTKDDAAVYYLESGAKHYVSDEIFERRGFSRWEMVEVSQAHLDSYRTGGALD